MSGHFRLGACLDPDTNSIPTARPKVGPHSLKTQPLGLAARMPLQAVQLGLQGERSLDQIAQASGRAHSTLQEWLDTFRAGGLEALLQDRRAENPGQPGKFGPGRPKTQWQEGLPAGRWRTVPQMQAWLQEVHGVKLALSSLNNKLGKAGAWRARARGQATAKTIPPLPLNSGRGCRGN